ncbi:MAG: hypothetical protein J5I93_13715 [Pirellulaceae bacterium]|nr:hypothetical protein [Pirellulaceae bacterium]
MSGDQKRDHTVVYVIALAVAVLALLPCCGGIGVALVLPAVQAARRQAAEQNLRRLSEAVANYHQTNNGWPADRHLAESGASLEPGQRIACTATLTELEPEFPWFENSVEQGDVAHSDGKAPRATFVLVSPPAHAGRQVRVLFKYAGAAARPPEIGHVGRTYRMDLPERFLAGQYDTIDNQELAGFALESE